MTGYRIGYACGPVQLIENMTKLQENVAACASVPSQYALIEAYQTEQAYEVMRKEFQERRDFIYEQLSAIEGIRCRKPKGTFYLFANIRETGMQSEEFAEKLLEEQHVAVVPGCAYGALYDDYIRIAFTKEMNILRQAVKRIRLFILDNKGDE